MGVTVHVTDDIDDKGADYEFATGLVVAGLALSVCDLCGAVVIAGGEEVHAAWHQRLRMAHNVAGGGIFGAFMGRSIRDTI